MKEYVLMEAGSTYKKKYKCPYCELRLTREDMIDHIEKAHSDMIPEGYSVARIVFNTINKKTEGRCVICGIITDWNETKCRYERICSKKSCKDSYIKMQRSRMVGSYGVENLLTSPEYAVDQQQKMLANRKISGSYKFPDGTIFGYTGKYELNALKFMAEVLECSSTDITTPGPIIYYTYNNEQHFYISDIYYQPYNLIIEIKDGGDNPNNRDMKDYRLKQIAKEKQIVKDKKYNYIRLTNNNFEQLMLIFMELKMQLVDNNIDNRIIRIYEDAGMSGTIAGALPNTNAPVYMIQNKLPDNSYAYTTSKDPTLSDMLYVDDKEKVPKIKHIAKKDLPGEYLTFEIKGKDADIKFEQLLGMARDGQEVTATDYFYKLYSGRSLLTDDQILFDKSFTMVENFEDSLNELRGTIYESIMLRMNTPLFPHLESSVVYGTGDLSAIAEIMEDNNGKYLYNRDLAMRTRSIPVNENFSRSQIDIMNQLVMNGGIDLDN